MVYQSNIPFRKLINAQEHNVQLTVDRKYLDVDTKFRFDSLTLAPGYFSIQAAQWDLDPAIKDIRIPILLEFVWENAYVKGVIGTAWQTSAKTNVPQMIKSLNNHFDLQKPTGIHSPLVFFDWVIAGYEKGDADLKTFHRDSAQLLYGTDYDAALHEESLPESIKQLPFVNTLKFPTTTDADILSELRIRMHLAPNAAVAMANEGVLRAFGWSDKSIPSRVSNQVQMVNNALNAYKMFMSDGSIPSLNVEGGSSFKIAPIINREVFKSNLATAYTNRARERKNDLLASDLNDVIETVAREFNFNFKFKYFTSSKRFEIQVPIDAKYSVALHIDPTLSERMGHGKVEKFTSKSAGLPVANMSDITETEKRAKTLVYDTGIVVVLLEKYTNLQTDQFAGLVVATLEAHTDGTMISKHVAPLPEFDVSFSTPEVRLGLYRFDENNKAMPLGWKVSAYLRGILVSTSTKASSGSGVEKSGKKKWTWEDGPEEYKRQRRYE